MTAYKTTSGLTRGIERMIERLEAGKIEGDREYHDVSTKVNSLIRECNALWSNPADADHFAHLKNRLLQAWHDATN